MSRRQPFALDIGISRSGERNWSDDQRWLGRRPLVRRVDLGAGRGLHRPVEQRVAGFPHPALEARARGPAARRRSAGRRSGCSPRWGRVTGRTAARTGSAARPSRARAAGPCSDRRRCWPAPAVRGRRSGGCTCGAACAPRAAARRRRGTSPPRTGRRGPRPRAGWPAAAATRPAGTAVGRRRRGRTAWGRCRGGDQRVDHPAAVEPARPAHDQRDADPAVVQRRLGAREREPVVGGEDHQRVVDELVLVERLRAPRPRPGRATARWPCRTPCRGASRVVRDVLRRPRVQRRRRPTRREELAVGLEEPDREEPRLAAARSRSGRSRSARPSPRASSRP